MGVLLSTGNAPRVEEASGARPGKGGFGLFRFVATDPTKQVAATGGVSRVQVDPHGLHGTAACPHLKTPWGTLKTLKRF